MAWSFYRTVTVDHTKCGATNSTDFPVAFFGTYAYLKTVGNGGDVTSSSGFDIVFYTDATATTKYDFELVNYVPTTGAVEIHVRIPTLSHTVDTVIYLFYGNSSITTDQGTTATWNSNINRVYHLPDGVSSISGANSTSTASTLSVTASLSPVTGQVDGGVNKPTNNADSMATNATTGVPTSGAFSISCWLKTTTTATSIFWSWGGGSPFNEVFLDINGPGTGKMGLGDVSTFGAAVTSANTYNDGNWHHVVGTYSGSGGTHASVIYVDGASAGTSSTSLTLHSTPTEIRAFGLCNDGGSSFQLVGNLDELRIYSVVLSADWVLAEYNNQFNPSTFYAIGAATPAGGGGGGVGGSILGRIINIAVRLH